MTIALITEQYQSLKEEASKGQLKIKQERAEKQRKRLRRSNGIDDVEILLSNQKILKTLQESEKKLNNELET